MLGCLFRRLPVRACKGQSRGQFRRSSPGRAEAVLEAVGSRAGLRALGLLRRREPGLRVPLPPRDPRADGRDPPDHVRPEVPLRALRPVFLLRRDREAQQFERKVSDAHLHHCQPDHLPFQRQSRRGFASLVHRAQAEGILGLLPRGHDPGADDGPLLHCKDDFQPACGSRSAELRWREALGPHELARGGADLRDAKRPGQPALGLRHALHVPGALHL
mmetsp:Transcript_42449/g.99001  ORF Transcript_42449/g.99001 Transcript_42449/m.99001 type:complete len:218 (+) Transcript_42449:759-1412(+)